MNNNISFFEILQFYDGINIFFINEPTLLFYRTPSEKYTKTHFKSSFLDENEEISSD